VNVCSIRRIMLIKNHQIFISLGHLRTFYQQEDLRTKAHCNKML
jgi:hypothetical protein